MNARMADKYQVGRVFIGGDAAHIHPPTGGQGLEYQCAGRLQSRVGSSRPSSTARRKNCSRRYEEERRPIAAEMLGALDQTVEAARARGDMRRGRESAAARSGLSRIESVSQQTGAIARNA